MWYIGRILNTVLIHVPQLKSVRTDEKAIFDYCELLAAAITPKKHFEETSETQ